jgi:gamma-glutamyltranspeptidase/glutathione hydrolase
MSLRSRSAGISLLLLVVALAAPRPVGAAHPEAPRGAGGAVSSAAPAATHAGIEILEAGGNAVDAAVATALALAVVHPQAGNLGGGGFAVVRFSDEVAALDFRETAPARASATMYLDGDGELIPESSLIGPLAAGTPGTPSGLAELHRRYGKLEWASVVAPAVRLADGGFRVTKRLADALADDRALLERFPETARIWLPEGRLPAAGDTVRLPDLAGALRAYAERGPDAIMSGAAAAAVEAVSSRYGGILRAADLEHYRPVWREPIRFRAYGWQVASMPLPSSGGIILGQVTGMLERAGWARAPRGGAVRAHVFAESCRRAYADRFLLGDPRTTRATSTQLLDDGWLDRRAASIDPGRATPSESVRAWPGTTRPETPQTTHLSVIDDAGNVVSLTTTLNGSFGCGVTVPGLGYLLNNEMDDFAAVPGRPNQFGLVQGEANAVGPGKRMLSSMSPTVAWNDDTVVALGSPGGSRIPTATLQVLLRLVVDGDPLQAAVNRPRIHHQWLPDRIDAEPDALAPETQAALERRGHVVRERMPVGEVCAVRGLPDGTAEAAADPRGPGAAAVVRPVDR